GFFKFTRNFSIGTKYLLALSISILLFLIATVFTFFQFTSSKAQVDDIIEKSQLANDMAQLALYVEQQDSLISDYIIIGNPSSVDDFHDVSDRLTDLIDRIEPQLTDEGHIHLFERVIHNNEVING